MKFEPKFTLEILRLNIPSNIVFQFYDKNIKEDNIENLIITILNDIKVNLFDLKENKIKDDIYLAKELERLKILSDKIKNNKIVQVLKEINK